MTDGDVTRLNRMYRCPNYDDLSQRYEETESEGHIPGELNQNWGENIK